MSLSSLDHPHSAHSLSRSYGRRSRNLDTTQALQIRNRDAPEPNHLLGISIEPTNDNFFSPFDAVHMYILLRSHNPSPCLEHPLNPRHHGTSTPWLRFNLSFAAPSHDRSATRRDDKAGPRYVVSGSKRYGGIFVKLTPKVRRGGSSGLTAIPTLHP